MILFNLWCGFCNIVVVMRVNKCPSIKEEVVLSSDTEVNECCLYRDMLGSCDFVVLDWDISEPCNFVVLVCDDFKEFSDEG